MHGQSRSQRWRHAAFVLLAAQTKAQRGAAVDNIKRFDLWHWPSVALALWPYPALSPSLPPSLPLSLSLRHCLPLPLSLPVTGSDREQMLHGTATTEPDNTTRTLPLCHIRLFNTLDPAEDIRPVLGDAERKAVDADESKAGFNQFDYRDPQGSLARSFVRTSFAWPCNTSSLHSFWATLLWIKHPDLFLVVQMMDFGLHLRLTPGLTQVTSTWTVLVTCWDTKLEHHCCSKSGCFFGRGVSI